MVVERVSSTHSWTANEKACVGSRRTAAVLVLPPVRPALCTL